MTELKEVKILMMDGCTRAEAEKHLERGTVIYTDLEENFNAYMDEWGIEGEDKEDFRKMVENKEPLPDWGVVENSGKVYFIQYCL